MDTTTTVEYDALCRAIAACGEGGQAELARRMQARGKRCDQRYVWNWVHRGKRVPSEFVLDVEAATGVSRHELRPDVFGERQSEAA